MGATENKALVRSFLASGNNGDLERCLELIDDRVVWTNIGTTKLSGKYVDKEALIKELLGPVFGKLKSGIEARPKRQRDSSTITPTVTNSGLETARSSR